MGSPDTYDVTVNSSKATPNIEELLKSLKVLLNIDVTIVSLKLIKDRLIINDTIEFTVPSNFYEFCILKT